MTGGLATPDQSRPPAPEAPKKTSRRRKQLPLAHQHAQQLNAWEATTQALRKRATARMIAEVHTLFAHRWAEIMKHKHQPDFAARVAALQAEQDATLQAMLKRTLGVLRGERAASRALLLDNHRRQRRASAQAQLAALARTAPAAAATLATLSQQRRRLMQQFMFAFAGRITTLRGLGRFMSQPQGLHPWHANSHPDNKR